MVVELSIDRTRQAMYTAVPDMNRNMQLLKTKS
jgi:hypothetical protein